MGKGGEKQKGGVDNVPTKDFSGLTRRGEVVAQEKKEQIDKNKDERNELADFIAKMLVALGHGASTVAEVFSGKKKFELGEVDPKVQKLLGLALNFAAALAKYPKNYRGPYEFMGQIIKHASDCGKWVKKIRKMAGFDSPEGKVVFDGQSRYSGRDYRGHEAKPEQLRRLLSPGDWVWYFNGNSSKRGLHSAMFLGWKDRGRLIANCAGGDRSMKWRVYEKGVSLNPRPPKGNPVVWINKPIA